MRHAKLLSALSLGFRPCGRIYKSNLWLAVRTIIITVTWRRLMKEQGDSEHKKIRHNRTEYWVPGGSTRSMRYVCCGMHRKSISCHLKIRRNKFRINGFTHRRVQAPKDRPRPPALVISLAIAHKCFVSGGSFVVMMTGNVSHVLDQDCVKTRMFCCEQHDAGSKDRRGQDPG